MSASQTREVTGRADDGEAKAEPVASLRPAVTEKDWQARVRHIAVLYGWRCLHQYDSRRTAPGWPDLVLCKPPRLIFAELKTDTGHLTGAQRDWLCWLAECGQEVAVWRPADLETVLRVLGPAGQRVP